MMDDEGSCVEARRAATSIAAQLSDMRGIAEQHLS
jgi:hypothetical protein